MRLKCSIQPLPKPRPAFTLVELLIVIAIIAILASLLFPAVTNASSKAKSISCLNNVRQLSIAWVMYANDHRDRLAYNLGGNVKEKTVAPKNPMNWVNGNMSWELDSDNTNYSLIQQASLAPYCSKSVKIYKCPSDQVLHEIQRQAGWKERARSYSMNAMVGNAGDLSLTGTNVNNPGYRQFFSLAEIPRPSSIFVFIDEHPDSINDGYFLIKRDDYTQPPVWYDLPAAHHGNGAVISFADGHVEKHRWEARTYAPSKPDVLQLPEDVPADQYTDFRWLLYNSSVRH